ncbi:MAG: DUF924 family protein, partial [Cyanobacteria bacterium J06558_2]
MNEYQFSAVLNFWFSESVKPFWFKKSQSFDQEIQQHFEVIYDQARLLMQEWSGEYSAIDLIFPLLLD